MVAPLLSSTWYRVASQRPRLREHVAVRIHRYRGEVWYVFHDELTGNSLRLGSTAYSYVSLLDGTRTLDQAWRDLVSRHGAAAPTQDEIINLLSQLHNADMLMSDSSPDAGEMVTRRNTAERRKHLNRILNPMAITLPLWDPDHLLDRIKPLGRVIFSRAGAAIWLVVIVHALVQAGQHWRELTDGGAERLIGMNNLFALSVSYLVIKFIHEMGHGLAVKTFGGEVHEMGVMLIVLAPSPYVNASAANGFRNKWRRGLVGAAGMIVELFVAGLALQVWTMVSPGVVRTLCFNATVVASVSTLLFNANPLMRYDGYFILCDLAELPNLAQRGSAWWGRQVDRLLLGIPDPRATALTPREQWWLLLYPPISLVYRLVVMFKIALYVAGQYLVVGVIMALWSFCSGLVLPSWRGLSSLWQKVADHWQPAKMRARVLAAGLAGAFILFVLPLPFHTKAEGVTWLPEDAIVRAGADGFVVRQLAPTGSAVRPGQTLFQSDDPELAARIAQLHAKLDGLETQRRIDLLDNRAHENVTQIALEQTGTELAREQNRADGLRALARSMGPLVTTRHTELVGDFHKQGDILGFVPPVSTHVIRVAVSQDDAGLVRTALRSVRVILANDLARSYPAVMIREVPEGSQELPSRALGDEGGGAAVTDPADPKREKSVERMFQFDLALPADASADFVGAHVYVRFDHGWEPLAVQAYRRLRQILMTSLNA